MLEARLRLPRWRSFPGGNSGGSSEWGRHWLAVLGSVGQPRDGNPAAAFAIYDTDKREITYCRAPYDVEAAANRIRANGLPPRLADRLAVGR
jgi:diadenosine tetraphosphatase ApaH/serine/threonine PP2A family protein phosphatase